MHHTLLSHLHRSDVRIIIFLLALVFIAVILLALWITGGFIFRYVFSPESEKASNIILFIHCGISILIGLFTPNSFLSGNVFFQNIFEQNAIWIPVTMLVAAFICLLLTGAIISTIAIVLEKSKR